MLKAKRTFQSVVEELIDGLENNTIAIDRGAAKSRNGQAADHTPILSAPILKKIVRDSETKMPGTETT
jgi:hypothetical protein